MKIYQTCFYVLIFTIATLFYPSIPVALHKKQRNPILISKTISSPPNSNILNKEVTKKENNMAIHRLNQKHFGVSDYEKAQQELQKFNRPLIGIVGQDSDWVSYQEYQKKILGSSY